MAKWGKVVLVLVILAVLGSAIYLLQTRRAPKNALRPSVSQVPFGQLPRYFPQGVFIEPDAKIVENYNTEFPDGRIWATRVYDTLGPPQDIKDKYEKYLMSLNGWTLGKGFFRENDVFLGASKETDSFIIHISRPKDPPNTTRVSITFITKQ